MFDIGFGKLALIGVVALLVLGPERLPRVARTAGALIRRARNSWASVRTEIERELATDDIKRSIREATQAMDIRGDVNAMADSIHGTGKPASTPASVTPLPEATASSGTAPSESASAASAATTPPHEPR